MKDTTTTPPILPRGTPMDIHDDTLNGNYFLRSTLGVSSLKKPDGGPHQDEGSQIPPTVGLMSMPTGRPDDTISELSYHSSLADGDLSDHAKDGENYNQNLATNALTINAINRAKNKRDGVSKYAVADALRSAGGVGVAGVIWNPDKVAMQQSTTHAINQEPVNDMLTVAAALRVAGSVAIAGATWTRKDKHKRKLKAAKEAINLVGQGGRIGEERKKYSIASALRTAGGVGIAGVIWTPNRKTTKLKAAANVVRAIPLSDRSKNIAEALRMAGGVAISGISWNPERKTQKGNKFRAAGQAVEVAQNATRQKRVGEALKIAGSVAIAGVSWIPVTKSKRPHFKAAATTVGLVTHHKTRSKYSIANALEIAAGVAISGASWTRHPKTFTPEPPSPTPLPKLLAVAELVARESRAATKFSTGYAQPFTPSLVSVGHTPMPRTPSLALVGRDEPANQTPLPSLGGSPEARTPPIVVVVPRDHTANYGSTVSIPRGEAGTPFYQRQNTPVIAIVAKPPTRKQKDEVQPQSPQTRTPSPKVAKAAVLATAAKRNHTPKPPLTKPASVAPQPSRSPSPNIAPIVAMAVLAKRNPTPIAKTESPVEDKRSPSPPPAAPVVAAAAHSTPLLQQRKLTPPDLKDRPKSKPEVAPLVIAAPLASNDNAPNKPNKKSLANLSKAEKLVKKKRSGRALATIKRSIDKFRN